jgi:hypothetical protein
LAGAGVAIGFSGKALAPRAERQWFKFIKCRYRRNEQVALVDGLIDKVLGEARKQDDPHAYLTDGSTDEFAWNWWIVPGVKLMAAMFKREVFADEREWRVVAAAEALSGPFTRFRVCDRALVPYLEFGLGALDQPLVDLVRVGPGPDVDLRMLVVDGLVNQIPDDSTMARNSVRVVRSSITLR